MAIQLAAWDSAHSITYLAAEHVHPSTHCCYISQCQGQIQKQGATMDANRHRATHFLHF
jgi:hypothetical protein